jgi:hypothetical protein
LNVYVNEPSVVPHPRAHLEAAGCLVDERDSYHLEVRLPRVASDEQAEHEVDVYVATWQALNPGVEAYVVELDEIPVDGALQRQRIGERDGDRASSRDGVLKTTAPHASNT